MQIRYHHHHHILQFFNVPPYLIAHPLMTGYFAKSVIVILDHAEEEVNNKLQTSEGGEVEGEKSSSTSSSGRGGDGGDGSV
jgi:hypothetical protein